MFFLFIYLMCMVIALNGIILLILCNKSKNVNRRDIIDIIVATILSFVPIANCIIALSFIMLGLYYILNTDFKFFSFNKLGRK